jgi:hypothetical protein
VDSPSQSRVVRVLTVAVDGARLTQRDPLSLLLTWNKCLLLANLISGGLIPAFGPDYRPARSAFVEQAILR